MASPAPESGCCQNLPSPQHNLAGQRGQVFLQLSTVNCQPSTVNRQLSTIIPVQPDLVLFHVSAVGVPSWVIGQKPKYEQGNKE